jgi:hypothetical protein
MIAVILQIMLAGCGLVAMWLATGRSASARRWAPVIGLAGQPAWLAFAVGADAWGLVLLSIAYTGVYARGVWVQWRLG